MNTKFSSGSIALRLSPFLLLLLVMALSLSTIVASASKPNAQDGSFKPLSGSLPQRPNVPNILCVDNSNSIVGTPCTNPTAYSSIQSAVDAAAPGDEIRLATRNFTGSGPSVVTVTVPLTITGGFPGGAGGWATPGTNPNATAVDGQNGRKSILIQNPVAVIVQNLAIVNGGIQNDSGGSVHVTNNFSLIIRDGGTSSGAFSIDSPLASINFSGGNHALFSGVSFSGPGATRFTGATVQVPGNMTAENVDLTGGTIMGDYPSNITITGIFNWSGGVMSATSNTSRSGTTNLGPSAELHLGGNNTSKFLSNRIMINNHNADMLCTNSCSFSIGNGAVFNNQPDATLIMQNNGSIADGGGASSIFSNTGTVRRQGDFTTSTLGNGNLIVANNGSIFVDSGTMSLGGNSSNSITEAGLYYVAAGTLISPALEFSGGNRSMGPGSNVGGGGIIRFNAGTVSSAGIFNIIGRTELNAATLILNGPSPTLADARINSGTIRSTTQPATTLTINGDTLNHEWHWSGGTIRDIKVRNSGVIHLDGVNSTKQLSNAIFTNEDQARAIMNSTSSGRLNVAEGAVFTNTATARFDIIGPNQTIGTNGGTQSNFYNVGTIFKSGINDTSVLGDGSLAFDNYGTVNIITGTLSLRGGTVLPNGGHTGTFDILSGATLQFSSGNKVDLFKSGSFIIGSGNVSFNSGTVTMGGTFNITGTTSLTGGTVSFDDDASTVNLTFQSGTLTSNFAPTFTVSGLFNWTGGTISGYGTIDLLNASSLRLTGNSPTWTLRSRTFINRHNALLETTGGGNFQIGNGAIFSNTLGASLEIRTNDNIRDAGGAASRFVNAGTISKTGGGISGISQIGTGNLTFDNIGNGATGGIVNIITATLSLEGGTSVGGGHTGAFDIAPLAVLRFNGGTHNLQPSSSIGGQGDVKIQAGTVTMELGNNYNLAGKTWLVGGTFNIGGNATTVDAAISGGTLSGSGIFTVTGRMDWTGGTMSGSGRTEIPENAALYMGLGAARTLSQRTLINNRGTVYLNDTNNNGLNLANGAVFTNTVGATFYFRNNGSIGTGPGTFTNQGTLIRDVGTGAATLGTGTLTVNNSGLIEVQTGVLAFGATYIQLGDDSSLYLNGGNVTKSGTALIINGGNIRGTGFITGNVTNGGGAIMPGGPDLAGMLTINGNYTQSGTGVMGLELGGFNPGVDSDKVVITGTGASGVATLGGELAVTAINGFNPDFDNTFRVLTYASRSGQFSLLNNNIGNGRFAMPVYGSNYMDLQVTDGSPVYTPTPTSTSTHTPTNTRTGTPAPRTSTPTVTPPGGCNINFSDVLLDNPFREYIRALYCAGVISGYGDTFRPNDDTTRAQLCKIVVLAMGWPIDTIGGPHFNDVPVGNTFYGFIETAYNHNAISGYADGTFGPGNNVTRAQLSKIIVIAKSWALNDPLADHFSDVPREHAFYRFIETAFAHGIISGYNDGTFRSNNNATRGQICKIVSLAINQP